MLYVKQEHLASQTGILEGTVLCECIGGTPRSPDCCSLSGSRKTTGICCETQLFTRIVSVRCVGFGARFFPNLGSQEATEAQRVLSLQEHRATSEH